VYWAFTNSGEILAAAILVAAIARYGRRGALLAIPVVPAAFAGWILWAGWPVFGALNIDVGMPVKWLAFVVCAGISFSSVYALSRLRPRLYELANPDRLSGPASGDRTPSRTASGSAPY
jgi:hypothetical protein